MKTKKITTTKTIYGLGGYDPQKPNNNVVELVVEEFVVPDEDYPNESSD